MEGKDMHRNIPGATPSAPPPPAPPPIEPALAHPPELPVRAAPAEAVIEQPEQAAIEASPVDSPKAQEIKAELAHLDDIEATLPAHDDGSEPDDVDDDGDAGRHDGTPHRKKRRHR